MVVKNLYKWEVNGCALEIRSVSQSGTKIKIVWRKWVREDKKSDKDMKENRRGVGSEGKIVRSERKREKELWSKEWKEDC